MPASDFIQTSRAARTHGRRNRVLATASILIATLLWPPACGRSASPTASTSTPSSPVLTGKGTPWQVVATADGDVSGLALDGHGHLYAAEFGNNRIVEFSLKGSVVRQWGASGSASGQLSQPTRVAVDALGNVYVTDTGSNRIQKFSLDGQPLAQWGGKGPAAGQFNFPIGIALDGRGNVYVAEFRNDRIQKLSPTGTPLASWGTKGSGQGQFDGGPAAVAVEANGDVYVSEAYGSDRIHEFSSAGEFIAQWGGSGSGPGKFSEPRGLAFDSQGHIFVGDIGNNRVQELSQTGQFIAQWQGPSTAPFPEQSYITMDVKGNLFVSDGRLILMTCVGSSGCN